MVTFQKMSINAGFFMKKSRRSLKEQGIFLSRLSEMLEKGYTIAAAIEFLGNIENNSYEEMLRRLQSGMPIHEVFHIEKFDKKTCAQLYFADKHGNIINVLYEAGRYLQKKYNDRKTLYKILQYPLILVFLLSFVLILLKNFLLPQFQILYQSMNYKPTVTISFFMTLLSHFRSYLFIFFISLFLCSFLFLLYLYKKPPIEKAKILSRIPFINKYFRLINSQFLASEWSFLLHSGFSIYEVLEIMQSQSFRPLLRDTAKTMREELTTGSSISSAIANVAIFDDQMITVIKHGEKNGRLDIELQFYSQFCLTGIEERMQKMFQLLQPIMFILIGIMVVAIYLSILLPMFEMIDSI